MTKFATSLRAGAAGCAVAAAAAFVSVAPAEAAPVPAPAAPVPAAPVLPLPEAGPFDFFVGFFQVIDNFTDGLPFIGGGTIVDSFLDIFFAPFGDYDH